MKQNKILQKSLTKGFTLIELLLVIVILGIIIVIALSIINPARLQRRAHEAVLLANSSKMCAAMFACGVSSAVITDCDELDEIGANTPPPIGAGGAATYVITTAGSISTFTATLPATAASRIAAADCTVTCTYDFATGTSTPATDNATNCY